jgi:predicted nucleotidyltransferase
MSPTALDLSRDNLKTYRPMEAIRIRKVMISADLTKRRRFANLTAREAAEILRNEFGAKKVILFGSLAQRGRFTLWSDIDLAVQGIPPSRFFEAVGAVTGMSSQFKIDLIDMDTCLPSLRNNIEAVGKSL